MNAPLQYTGKRHLHLTVMEDHAAIAKAAAQRIAAALRAKPDLVLGLATGATMEPVYAELVRMHRDEGLDFSQARFFNLDAYKGLPSTDRNSYDNQLRKLLLKKVNANPENIHLVQGIGFDPAAYEAEIKKAGGIDIQLLGLGGEGHIGFNEVGSGFDSRTREIKLQPRTLEDNAMYFSKPGEKVPESAYTMGIGTILEAKEIIALANNPNKAWTVRNLMDSTGQSSQELTSLELAQLVHATNGALSHEAITGFFDAMAANRREGSDPVKDLPARALHAHPKVTLLVDEEAASMTRVTDLLQQSNLTPKQVERLVAKFAPKELTVNAGGKPSTLFLPSGFDFYDPAVMDINEKFDPANQTHAKALEKALERATDVGVGAHQDDVEIMAGPMLLESKRNAEKQWLTIIVTDGAASKSVLNGTSSSKTPRELTDLRQREQREAALAAGTPVIQLKYPSAAVNGHMGVRKKEEASFALGTLFAAMPKLENVFGHNPLDKHATHLGTFAVQTAALRAAHNPTLKNVYAMEVWGGLTGIPEAQMEMFVVDNQKDLDQMGTLIRFYKSQIEGQGRDYAIAAMGRVAGHGGFVSNPHLSNPPPGMMIGLNVTDFTQGESNDMGALTRELLDRAAAVKIKFAEKHPIPETPDLSKGFIGNLQKQRGAAERH